jgi:hypothetical protein
MILFNFQGAVGRRVSRKLGKQCADYSGGIRKQVFLVGSFLALFIAATLAAPANAYDLTPEAEALEKILHKEITRAKDHRWRTSLAGAEWRTSLAGALQRYCESVLVQVPRNTPQEDRWLDQETRRLKSEAEEPPSLVTAPLNERLASSEQRWARVEQGWATIMASPENARKTLIARFSTCSDLAKKLNGPGQKSSAATVLLWVQLSDLFLVDEMIWHPADILGLVSQNDCLRDRASQTLMVTTGLMGDIPNFPDKNDLCHLHNLSNSIHLNIVIPLLEAEAHPASKNKLPSDQPPPAQALNSQQPGHGWYKQGAGPEEFQRTKARCLMNAEMTTTEGEGGRWALILMTCMRSEGWTIQ